MSKRIIVVDDTAYMRALIRKTLEAVGFEVVGEAENGAAGLALYRQQQPDLMIMNVVMPDRSGLETLKELKSWDPHAKVIVCSGMGQSSTVFSAIKAGATDFLAKPFAPQRLIQTVCKALNLKFIQAPSGQ